MQNEWEWIKMRKGESEEPVYHLLLKTLPST